MNYKKIIILIFSIVFLAIVLPAMIYFYSQTNKSANNTKVNTSDNLFCDRETSTRAKYLCVKQQAVKKFDINNCQSIEDQTWQIDCRQAVEYSLAIKKKDSNGCISLLDVMAAKTCLSEIFKQDFEKINCDLIKQQDLKKHCQSEKLLYTARKKNDAKICESIPENIKKANCLSEISKIDLHSDSDQDGVDFLQEVVSGTDPDKKDTDNDGRLDKEDIKDGDYSLKDSNLANIDNNFIIYCYNIEDKKIKAVCFNEIKDQKIDLKFCENIKNSDLWNYCTKKFNEQIKK